jgi:hypothetical protein
MRAWLVAVLLASPAARADEPRDLTLDAEPTVMLDGALSIRLAGAAQLDDSAGAHLDWGDERLTIVARDLGMAPVRAGTTRDRIAAALPDDGVACAPIEPLALARLLIAFSAAPRAARLIDGRRLVYAAFASDRTDRLFELAFYADDTGTWSPLAARIAATLVVH